MSSDITQGRAYSKKLPMSKTGIILGKLLDSMNQPTSLGLLDLAPQLGMTRMLKGTKVFHGTEVVEQPIINYKPYVMQPDEALKIIGRKYGENWGRLPAAEKEFDKLVFGGEPPVVTRPKLFEHFQPSKAGQGAGGDLYGKGIYLTEHPEIAAGYAGGEGKIRTHNIPPQAKILDIDNVSSADFRKFSMWLPEEALKDTKFKNYLAEVSDILDKDRGLHDFRAVTQSVRINLDEWARRTGKPLTFSDQTVYDAIKKAGWDGVTYKAGQLSGLPKGVPEGTRNYVIYNYDIINEPRKAIKPTAKGVK